jgi:predicted phosphoribosyltransferase/dienelactone hydrolase
MKTLPDSTILRQAAIPVGRALLRGDLCVPAGARAIVVFAHGSGSSRRSPRNRFVADALQRAGLGTLLLDLLTEEEAATDERTGELRFDIDFLARRLSIATEWVLHDEATRDLAIGYFGASTGAAAALIGAAERPNVVKAVVSRGGRPDLARSSLSRVRAPTLLIVGANDPTVAVLNREALELMSCEKRLEIVPRATHLFSEPGALEEVAKHAERWFTSHLIEPRRPTDDPPQDRAEEDASMKPRVPARFEDRRHAGRLLGRALRQRHLSNPVVLGIPRGGVPVAAEVAVALGAPLGVVVARKLRAPFQPELAIGAVCADGTIFIDANTARLVRVDQDYVDQEVKLRAAEAREREQRFDRSRLPSLTGRIVIIVDDGIATGATAVAALRSVKRGKEAAKVILAVPVGAPESIAMLRNEADEVICLREDPDFFAVGECYFDFPQIEDDEVDAIMQGYALKDRPSSNSKPEQPRS